jgi:hypothetical protein
MDPDPDPGGPKIYTYPTDQDPQHCYFCLIIDGFGSGSSGPKNIPILRIRIRNTACGGGVAFLLTGPCRALLCMAGVKVVEKSCESWS